MTREPIYQALLAKLAATAQFNTVSRRFKTFANVAPPDRPALFLIQRSENVSTTSGLNPIWSIQCDAYIYVSVGGDPSVAPAQILNPILDAIELALAPDQITNKQTLGGLVQHCRIDGSIQIDESINGDQSIALIPFEIRTA